MRKNKVKMKVIQFYGRYFYRTHHENKSFRKEWRSLYRS